MRSPCCPSLYQVNTRILLAELPHAKGRHASLDQVSDEFFDRLAVAGFDWLWLLGVWQTGPAGCAVSRREPQLRREFEAVLPDLVEEDICGSCFAVRDYAVHTEFGGNEALARFRQRLHRGGVRLLLDYVPNHTALDHRWAWEHPEYYIGGDEADLAAEPHNYCRVETRLGPRILAHGRDPNFPAWTDTLQLNYRSRALRQAMVAELEKVAGLCDGVRCDMAMLLLPEVIQRTWGEKSLPGDGTPPVDQPFWPEAIARVRTLHPDFLFMAEVYWNLEGELQRQGFDYTYDKGLYDRLRAGDAEAVRQHLRADSNYQRRSVRFLENHDEPRAANVFPLLTHQAAAIVAYLVPGMRLFHDGQLEGRRIRVPVHLARRPAEPVDSVLCDYYRRLLECVKLPVVREGQWQLLECDAPWEGNATWRQFVAFLWQGPQAERLLVAVNYGDERGQCYVRLPLSDLPGKKFLLCDRMGRASYQRDGTDLARRGLYLDLPAWHYHVFDLVSP